MKPNEGVPFMDEYKAAIERAKETEVEGEALTLMELQEKRLMKERLDLKKPPTHSSFEEVKAEQEKIIQNAAKDAEIPYSWYKEV